MIDGHYKPIGERSKRQDLDQDIKETVHAVNASSKAQSALIQ